MSEIIGKKHTHFFFWVITLPGLHAKTKLVLNYGLFNFLERTEKYGSAASYLAVTNLALITCAVSRSCLKNEFCTQNPFT